MKNTLQKQNMNIHILASPHPQFDEILDFPPKRIKYKINRIKTPYHGWITENKIKLHNRIMSVLPLPRMTRTKTDADLIHSTRGIIQIRPKKPWIVDLESGGVFTSFNYRSMKRPLVKKMIKDALSSKRCKRILPQSEAAKKDLLKAIDCNKFKDKIEVLYLAMRPCKKKRTPRKDKKVKLSFIGKTFYGKGGHDLLRAYEILTKKYDNLELKIKGDAPKKYRNLNLPGLKFIEGHFPRDELFDKMYFDADIFVLPTHTDNYGVVFLEAMSTGLPIVGTTSFTVPELIDDGKNGFLIKTPYTWENYLPKGKGDFPHKRFINDIEKEHPEIIKQLVEKLSILIEDKKLREKMGKEGRKMIEEGRLSIKERNKKLKRIYEEALKDD